MPDYRLGKIYAIRAPSTDNIYIGSTVRSLNTRMSDHKSGYKQWLTTKNEYCYSFKILELPEYYIELLEEYPCNTKQELYRREREYIEAHINCINKQIPTRTVSEYREQYNKERKAYSKAKREANRELYNKYHREYREKMLSKKAKLDSDKFITESLKSFGF